MSVGGPITMGSAPMILSSGTSEPTTRECAMSPTMPTLRPSMCPSVSRIVNASSSACVGCWCLPSPPLTTWASMCCVRMRGAPSCLLRTTMRSQFMASSVSAVSARVSPLVVDELEAEKLMTSPERRLPAISKLVRVRVEGSRKRLMMVRPRRVGSFLIARSLTSLKLLAVSKISTISSAEYSSMSMRCLCCNISPHLRAPC